MALSGSWVPELVQWHLKGEEVLVEREFPHLLLSPLCLWDKAQLGMNVVSQREAQKPAAAGVALFVHAAVSIPTGQPCQSQL